MKTLKMLPVLVSVLLALAFAPSTVFAMEDSESEGGALEVAELSVQDTPILPASGMWGDCNWTIGDDGVLSIAPSEEGNTGANVQGCRSPWYEYNGLITKVVFSKRGDECVKFPQNSAFLFCFNESTQYDVIPGGTGNLIASFEGLENVDTSSVIDMRCMFYDCSHVTELDLSSFDTSKVETFGGSPSSVYDASWYSGWCSGMFSKCASLESVNLSSFNTSKAINMGNMFGDCTALKRLDLSSFNTSNVVGMEKMFENCSALESLNITSFNPAKVTNMHRMFRGCSSLENLALSNFHTVDVVDMSEMFYGCASLKSLDLTSFNTEKVISNSLSSGMVSMFCNCASLKNLDLSTFNTEGVLSMGDMFSGCASLESLNLSSFNTARVVEMCGMFKGCAKLESLDLSKFNTAKVTNMAQMFSGCSSLSSLVLSSFNTTNVQRMEWMFSDCSSLEALDLSHFNTANVTDMTGMFSGCTALQRLDISSFDMSSLDETQAYDSTDSPMVMKMKYMFTVCPSLSEILLGSQVALNYWSYLPAPPDDDGIHTGKWQRISDSVTVTNTELVQRSGEDIAGTWIWEITGAMASDIDISDATVVLATGSYIYDGTIKQPAVSSVSVDGAIVPAGAYGVSYPAGCTDVGTYLVTVTAEPGSGYTGSATATFEISNRNSSSGDVALTPAELKEKADRAQAEAEAAAAREKEARRVLQQAQDDLAAAKAAVELASQAYDKADQEAQTAFNKAKADANAEASNAAQALQNAQAESAAAQNALDAANAQKAEADAALVAANNTYSAAQQALATAQANLAILETALSNAEKDLADASVVEGEGVADVIEFYESIGDGFDAESFDIEKSQEWVDPSVLAETHMGVTGDATSFDNVKAVFDHLRYCNQIRESHNLTPLKITSECMVAAQIQVNWSDSNIQHSEAFPVAENLAWGMSNPYAAWYNSEKSYYESAVAKNPSLADMSLSEMMRQYPDIASHVGHYLNIIDSNHLYTGFAISTDPSGSYSIAYSQTFTSYVRDKAYTVDEYEALFLAAIAGPQMSEEQQAIVAEKQAIVDAAKTNRDNAQAEVAAREIELTNAGVAKTNAESAVNTAAENVTAATNRVNSATVALASAQTANTNAQSKASRAAALSYSGASTANIDDADFAHLNAKVAAVRQAKSALATAQEQKVLAETVVAQAEQALQVATLAAEAARRTADEALAAFEAVRISIKGARVQLAQTSFSYDGAAKRPEVVSVTLADGTSLPEGSFTVEYSNNVNVGKATVTVTGVVFYKDSATASFDIVQASTPVVDQPSSPAKLASRISLAGQTKVYNGKAQAYSGKVTRSGSTGAVTYAYYSDARCTKPVRAASVKGAGTYYVRAALAPDASHEGATSGAARLVIAKAANPMKARAVSRSVRAKDLRGKAVTVAGAVAFTKKPAGKVAYARVKKGSSARLAINAKTGKVTVKKGTKKGTYRMKVKVTAKGNANYKAKSQTLTLTVKVKQA